VMQDYRLPMPAIYSSAIAKIAQIKQSVKVLELLKYVKGTVNDSEWDEVVMAGIIVFVEQHKDLKTADNLINKLVSVKSKVAAHILCKKLKAAYLAAVKANDLALIELISNEARKQNDRTVHELCEKYLAQVSGFLSTG